MTRKTLVFLIVLFSTLIQGCTPYNAPIIDLEQPPSQLIKTHLVEEGETLYSIAWRYDFNVRELARINRLSEPYRVRKGQVISLDKNIKSASMPVIEKVKKAVSKVTDKSRSTAKTTTINQSLTKLGQNKLRWQRPINCLLYTSPSPRDS